MAIGRRVIETLITAKDRTAQAFDSATRRVSKYGAAVKTIAKSFTGIGSVLAGAGVAAGVKSITDDLERLGETASKLGITTEALSELRFAAQETGVSAQTLDTALQRLVRRVSEAAAGTGVAAKALEELGLNAKELNTQAPDEIFKRIAEAFGDITSQGDRVRLTVALFDTEAAGLVNTLDLGRRGLEALAAEARELGIAWGKDATDAAKEFNKNIRRLEISTDALAAKVANKLVPNWVAWLELIRRGGKEEERGIVSAELEEVSNKIVNIRDKIKQLEAGPSIGDAIAARGVSLEELTARQAQYVERLKQQLKDLEEEQAKLIGGESTKNALSAREKLERDHAKEMAAARDAQTAALALTIKERLALLKANLAESQGYAASQRALIAEINSALGNFDGGGGGEYIDVLRKIDAAWAALGAGDFAGTLGLISSGLETLGDYEGSGDASAASVGLLRDRFKELNEAAAEGSEKEFKKGVADATDEYEAFKKEVETKPAKLVVIPDPASGKIIHTQAQKQIDNAGAVNIKVIGVFGGFEAPSVEAANPNDTITVTELSEKRGFRL